MYEAEGLIFETEEEAAQARSEADAVRYIRERTKMDDPDMVLKLYNNLLKKQLFKTEVGLKFLFELQEFLVTIPYIKSEDIKPIPARNNAKAQMEDLRKKQLEKKIRAKDKRRTRSFRIPFFITLFTSIVLAASVIGMYVIMITTGADEVIDYENELVDRYSVWEQELNEKESQLMEWQNRLEELENGQN
ncbi:hypothetical protein [Agathobacter ruminis]|uniref:Uncharacterized protein n=1 Tax=Agathobacter ruminis TaxID=1712665 RepID=A0A2G3E0U3_9FIRM|nr:hypothetical protein [Agathobacter ruminis]MDC7301380.1 hypothetical protein [Agathobacter ruminis]PHU36906.1 hypothetical protein CSX02_10400 [Agathobacter ruminis]